MYGLGFSYAKAPSKCFRDGASPAVPGVYEGCTFVFPYLDWKEVIKLSLLVVDIEVGYDIRPCGLVEPGWGWATASRL